MRHYQEPGLVAPRNWEASLNGACPTFSVRPGREHAGRAVIEHPGLAKALPVAAPLPVHQGVDQIKQRDPQHELQPSFQAVVNNDIVDLGSLTSMLHSDSYFGNGQVTVSRVVQTSMVGVMSAGHSQWQPFRIDCSVMNARMSVQ